MTEMNKLSCGVLIFTLGMTGIAHAGLADKDVPRLDQVGSGTGSQSADKEGSNVNFERQSNINVAIQKAVNANESAITDVKNSMVDVKAQADAAAASAAGAAETVTAAQTAVTAAQSAAEGAQQNADKAVKEAQSVRQDYATANKNMVDAAANAASAKKEAEKNTSRVNAAVSDIEGYKEATSERVTQFEQTTNDTVGSIRNEVGEVRASIQGAIQDSASALIKSTHAEELANEATLTVQRVEQGLAQEVVDRKADVERGIKSANDYTDRKVAQFEEKLEEAKKVAAAGAASALAASQIPQVSQGSAFSLGVGMGNYSGESALALGMSARMGDYTVTKIALTTDTTTNVGGGIGIAVEW